MEWRVMTHRAVLLGTVWFGAWTAYEVYRWLVGEVPHHYNVLTMVIATAIFYGGGRFGLYLIDRALGRP